MKESMREKEFKVLVPKAITNNNKHQTGSMKMNYAYAVQSRL
jgi:hypothetical protein